MMKKALCAIMAFCMIFTMVGVTGAVAAEESNVRIIVDVADELMTYQKGSFTADNVLKVDLYVDGIDPDTEYVQVVGVIKLRFDSAKAEPLTKVSGGQDTLVCEVDDYWNLSATKGYPGEIRLNFGMYGRGAEPDYDGSTPLPIRLGTAYIKLNDEAAKPGSSLGITIGTDEMEVTNASDFAQYTWEFNAESFTFSIPDNRPEMTGVTVDDALCPYDGQVHNIDVSGYPDGSTVTYTYDGEAFTGTKNVGYYEITAKVEHDEYKPYTTTAVLDIVAKDVTASNIIASKTYDGTANVTLSGGTITGLIDGDDVELDFPAASAADANVGNNKAVTLNGDITLSGADAGNYNLTPQPTVTANITPVDITLTGKTIRQSNTETIPTELYDITSGQVYGNDTLSGNVEITGLTEDKLPGVYPILKGSLANSNYNINFIDGSLTLTAVQNVTTSLPATVNATYGDAATVETLNLDPGNADAQVTVLSNNPSVATVTYANNIITVTPVKAGSAKITVKVAGTNIYDEKVIESNVVVKKKTLTIESLDAVDREYDGSTNVALTGGTLTGVVEGDDVTFPMTATISSKNVGTYIVTLPALTGTDVDNYELDVTNPDVEISKKSISATVQGTDREYDATTDFVATATLDDVIGSDAVIADCTEDALDSKNAGTRTGSVTVSLTGADAANYELTQVTFDAVQIEVSPKAITATVEATDRVYDATTDFVATATLGGVIDGDDVDSSAEGTLTSKNAGSYIDGSVTVTLTGADAANYVLTQDTFNDVAVEIFEKEITATVEAIDRDYDATTVFEATATLDDVIDGDDVDSLAEGTLTSKNAGSYTDGSVTVTLTGADAANYVLTQDTFNDVAVEIFAKQITATVEATDRVYDATTAVEAIATLADVISGDTVSATVVASVYSKNAATYVNGNAVVTLEGDDSANYVLAQSEFNDLVVTISPKALAITGITATNRKADGTTDVALDATNAALVGVIDGDAVSPVVPATGSIESATAGSDKAVTIGAITLEGVDALNYTVTAPTDVTVDITSASSSNYRPSSGSSNSSTTTPVTPDKDDEKKDDETTGDDKEEDLTKATADVSLKENADEIRFVETDEEGNFYPDADATRDDVINALNEVLNIENATGDCALTDIEDAENADIIELFTKANIIAGYEDGTFRGDATITRAEFVKVLAVALGVEVKEYEEDKFSDISGHWAADYVNSFAELGYIIGYEDGTFKPDASISRAEVVIVVNRVIGKDVKNTDNANVTISDMDDSHWAYEYIMAAVK